ncbi:hypothetical protein [Endozoicomonas lisbonensis]|uniref:ExoP galactose-binding-like domain-containing protein n=1 Tax=Endozoicomonas lisbonensis TaxID=3120522 RepID=A0ABV2SJ69_9GAMM
MKKAVKTFALSAISVALLSGCILDDKYEDGSGGSGGAPAERTNNTVNFYGWANTGNLGNDEAFELFTVDSTGKMTLIEREDVNTDQGNIKTGEYDPEGEGWLPDDAVHVTITDGAGGSIIAKSDTRWDFTPTTTGAKWGKGVVRTTIHPITTPEADSRVFIEVPGSKLDITDLYNSLSGSTQNVGQRIQIAHSCFTGSNLTSTTTPFKFISESDLEFAIEEITIRSNSYASGGYAYDCSLNNEKASDEIFSLAEGSDLEEATGWASEIIHFQHGNGASFAAKNNGVELTVGGNGNTGLEFASPSEDEEKTFKNLSYHVANSKLQFNLIVDNVPAEQKLPNFRVRMTGDEIDHQFDEDGDFTGDDYKTTNTPTINIDLSDYVEGQVKVVELPVAAFFEAPNGEMKANLPRNINRILIQSNGGAGGVYAGMTMHISDIKFVANPTDSE